MVLHRNWREQVVLTGGTNAPRAVHADRQSSMVVPPVPPFGTTKSLRIGCSTTGTPGPTAVLSWDAKACSGNPRASARLPLNTFKGAVRASFRKPAPRAADVCPAMKLVGKPNAGNRPVLAGLPTHPSYHIKTWRSSTKGLRDTLSTLSGSGRTGRRRRFASSARIAVCQCSQEGDDVVDLLARQTRLVSDVPVERRLDIDVGLILRRQVVVLAHRAVGLASRSM